MADIRIDNLYKHFGKQAVLRNVSLNIADGEFFVVVGPSGCGKSTLLRIVAGLEQLSSGEIRIGGRLVNKLAPGRRNAAMVFQNYALLPHLTVFENIAFGMCIRREPRDEIRRRVAEAARILELDPFLQKRPAQLSGGQCQRVALGRALVRQPDVFLFDEPLSNLDARLRGDMRAELLRLHARFPATTLYVTHDQIEAMTLGDRICVIKEGAIQQIAGADEIYNSPANQFVAAFFGAPPMNIVSGRLSGSGGAFRLSLGGTAPMNLWIKFPDLPDALTDLPVAVGMRPEKIRAGVGRAPDDLAIRGTVELAEMTGADAHVHFRWQDLRLSARLDAARLPAPGTTMDLWFSQSDMHFFKDDGWRLRALNNRKGK